MTCSFPGRRCSGCNPLTYWWEVGDEFKDALLIRGDIQSLDQPQCHERYRWPTFGVIALDAMAGQPCDADRRDSSTAGDRSSPQAGSVIVLGGRALTRLACLIGRSSWLNAASDWGRQTSQSRCNPSHYLSVSTLRSHSAPAPAPRLAPPSEPGGRCLLLVCMFRSRSRPGLGTAAQVRGL